MYSDVMKYVLQREQNIITITRKETNNNGNSPFKYNLLRNDYIAGIVLNTFYIISLILIKFSQIIIILQNLHFKELKFKRLNNLFKITKLFNVRA